ncbi:MULTISPECIES: hypothetical protein [Paenarthrobacter]|uniref:Uncharacterized protein n=1 Tax=Paenarthrobacter ureafaciens TaxID=37931 RepID=A0AAX3ERC5_PAEUR|nr:MULTISPECIES: hypothetical protein [Paenarthrobacter]MDO5867067.1 hypothetical protein [Paenarthrobacter sp. SD-2]MDO5878236.1 hypothetical protein [Paenarthrobacter sp. SD-1]UYV95558.1 hypothetical protein NL395_23070 [Paenarthrobacter ureafaciens]UYW00158.1 hypothetical protein NL394_23455 [Paenarthrobacter ureafaciens]
MMAVISASSHTFHVVCRTCLWMAPRPLPEAEAFRSADTHTADCPGHIPASRSAAQQRRARNILAGNY